MGENKQLLLANHSFFLYNVSCLGKRGFFLGTLEEWMIFLALGAAMLLWLFLIWPGGGRRITGTQYFAHRGLWDSECPENSLPAFQRAADRGLGIELDVRLCADGTVAVFHDENTARMCGESLIAEQTPYDRLQMLLLKDTSLHIPTLRQVLDCVQGKSFLLIELKGKGTDCELCRRVMEELRDYPGAYCVESFNPFLLRYMKKHFPAVIRGQLTGVQGKGIRQRVLCFLCNSLAVNLLSRPDFISESIKQHRSFSSRILESCFGMQRAVWVLHQEDMIQRNKTNNCLVIFEDFMPDIQAK